MRWEILLLLFGISLGVFIAAGYLMSAIPRKKPDVQTEAILKRLPAWDCGLCGEVSCAAFARRLRESPTEGVCVPGGPAVEKNLASLLGRSPYRKRNGSSVAVVACGGDDSAVKPSFNYAGYRDCAAAARLYGGPRACGSGCLGYGNCVSSCEKGAIAILNGLARIDPDLCDGCGDCVSVCPTGVIKLLPRRDMWYVACSSTAPGAVKEASCSASCTGCGICERRSAGSEFTVRNNLAAASLATTGNWASIAADCPTGVIRRVGEEKQAGRPFGKRNAGL